MKFLKLLKGEAGVGIILMFVTVVALVLANSPFSHFYTKFLDTLIRVQFGNLDIAKPLIL